MVTLARFNIVRVIILAFLRERVKSIIAHPDVFAIGSVNQLFPVLQVAKNKTPIAGLVKL